MNLPVISVVGKRDVGKTTLIEKLIPALEARGVRVATIKHDVHGFDMDKPGKDTYRHFAAGARTVIIASPAKLAYQKRLDGPLPLDRLAAMITDADLILTEGYKSADAPKIEVFRQGLHDTTLCSPQDQMAALVTDAEIDLGCPRFGLDQIEQLADHLIKNYLGK